MADTADADTNAGGLVRVTVTRSVEGTRSEFLVARIRPMTVLDALLAVQREHDPALAFRFSCRVGMCGTCTVRVDGRSALACQTEIPADTDRIRVDPLAGLPVVRDLIVDTGPFWQAWASVRPYLVPGEDADVGMDAEPAVIAPDSAERRAIDPALDCIGCAACFSSCGIASAHRDFVGPAALNRAMVLVADSRDSATAERLEVVGAESGVDRCHYIYGCTAACPKGLDPARAIRRLRGRRFRGDR
ncbi:MULTISPECIES: succinate dehydrogenase/fumarate reductase iron-sulfur subunit [Prauserella salsuginis group]|uniref:Fumarate reductase iron-sulfur subunit n=2 Tax=Prauserella salsuginis group TaxID=2893672 RepID=A0A839XN93_9PSEU|nr:MULTISPECIES: 2Fe-2S iron-sulfur cluster-binding protein [Prauserella salsuginis group]MBB3664211.1 succinate dehydrogenase / fumarate reductase iron-sulfur subunit/fumarate reductase iron-sulfur subunit [Prauserella sediminis]MCR3721660.1 fumarate reductase iron-sulfur subunit [Prauserella flava]MCR3734352.1 fumarate reductase iron-sulfur subunit [Prauserella salsuginis]